MLALMKKYSLFLLVVFFTISIAFIEWYIITKEFIPQNDPGEFDILKSYETTFKVLYFLFLFTNLSFFVILASFLFFKNKLSLVLVKNIYMSLGYLLLIIVLIQIIF